MASIVHYVLICFSLTINYAIGNNMEGFIVGGRFTKIVKYPHAAFLQSMCTKKIWICGSSVLNQNILITAGHCVNECVLKHKHTAIIFMGHQELNKVTTLRKVQNIIRHKRYNDERADNDIAMISLDRPVPLGKLIKRVVISPIFPRVCQGFVAGWGSTDTQKMSPVLKQVYQKLRSKKTCNQHGRIQKGVFCCTGRGESAPNGGDSGSGLIVKNFQQIGLVSYRVERIPYLMVYTNISYYYDWIMENSKKLFCSTTLNLD